MKRISYILAILGFLPQTFAQEATKKETTKGGTEIKIEEGKTNIADEGGNIYVERGYKGIVPGLRDKPLVESKAKQAGGDGGPVLEWVGFQPFEQYSRVFLKVSGKFTFTVAKPKPDKIVVTIPSCKVQTPNDERFLITRAFPTQVDSIFTHPSEEGTTVEIVLKKNTTYLYKQEGEYVFIDISL
jgi:hypothetical protein